MSEQRAAYRTAREVVDGVMTEKQLQARIVKLAHLLGYRVSHPWLSIKSERGYPDLTLCKPPRLIFIEVKTETGRVSLEQTAWIYDLHCCPNVEAYIFRPHDWEAIVAILEGQDHKGGETDAKGV